MKTSDKLKILNDLTLMDWLLEGDDDESLRVLVNALAEYFLDGKRPQDYVPSSEFDEGYSMRVHFADSGYDVDWYDMVTFDFCSNIDPGEIGYDISFNSSNSESEITEHVGDYVHAWCSACRRAFTEALETKND